MDIWLVVVIAVTQLVLGGMGVYVSLRPPKSEHHWWWLSGFVAVGIIGVALTGVLAKMGSEEQRSTAKMQDQMRSDLKDAKDKMDASLLNQQYTKGHLDSLVLLVSKSGQGNPDIASAIKELARENSQKIADMNASNVDLCGRTNVLAIKIRQFQNEFENQQGQDEVASWQKEKTATTDAERRNLFAQNAQRVMLAEQKHESDFREVYFVDAKYLRDLLAERLPKATKDILISNNLQADGNLQRGSMNGAFNEYAIANYLDELAKSLCQGRGR